MLDSLIYLLEKDRFDLSYRRTFNQSRVLQECILQELRVIAPEVAQTILMHNSKKKKSISSSREDFTPVPSSSVTLYSLLAHFSQKELFEQFLAFPLLSVDSIDPHWADVSVLKKQLSDEPTAKSRKKFLAIVEALTAHPLLHYFRFDFKKILTIVVFKALFIFAVPPQVAARSIPPVVLARRRALREMSRRSRRSAFPSACPASTPSPSRPASTRTARTARASSPTTLHQRSRRPRPRTSPSTSPALPAPRCWTTCTGRNDRWTIRSTSRDSAQTSD